MSESPKFTFFYRKYLCSGDKIQYKAEIVSKTKQTAHMFEIFANNYEKFG